MSRKMLIDAASPEEVRVCVLENGKVEEFDFETASRKALRGNIYLARVTRVEPSLQAAFIEYGGNRHGFLAFNEIHPDYYQIPVSDREAIRAAEAEEAALADRLNLSPSDDVGVAAGERASEFPDDDEAEPDHHSDETAAEAGDAVADEEDKPKRGRRRRRSRRRPADGAAEAGAEAGDAGDASTDDFTAGDDAEDDRLAGRDADGDGDGDGDSTRGAAENGADNEPANDASGDDDDRDDEDEEEERDEEDDAEDGNDLDEDDSEGARLNDEIDEDGGDDDLADSDDASTDEDGEAGDIRDLSAFADAEDRFADESDEDDAEADEEEVEDDDDSEADELDAATRSELMARYEAAKKKRMRLLRNYKIQEVIKRRQILLVQVVKEERGNKGAALTTYMSLAGRYCVLMPNTARGGGISRKIPSASDRKRLRKVVDGLDAPKGMGLIIRTAGAKRTKAEIKRDYDYLARLWENIRTQTLQSIAPALIYEEASLIKRAIRDMYDKDIDQVLVEGDTGYREAKDFMKMLMPSHAKNVQPYKETTPLFFKYGVESQLDAMYQPVVRLKSGGYIVINQTEALIAIDVNSGKATRERNIEQTALKTNLEAASELARQCRLRDLAGLIVVDFIDMEEHRNNRTVEKRFKDALKTDRARIQVGRISGFGLLEMSRQRRRSGIVDGTTSACPTCQGAGAVRSREMSGLRILRAIESDAIAGRAETLSVSAATDVVLHILNEKRDWLSRIEKTYGVKVLLTADPEKRGDQFDVERSGVRRHQTATAAVQADFSEPVIAEDQVEDEDVASDDDREGRERAASDRGDEEGGTRRRRRRRRRTRRPTDSEGEAMAAEVGTAGDQIEGDDGESDDEAPGAAAGDGGEDREGDGDRPRKRRRRGRRGGRRNPRTGDGEELAADGSADAGGDVEAGDDQDAGYEAGKAVEADDMTIAEAAAAAAEDRVDGDADPADQYIDAPVEPAAPAARNAQPAMAMQAPDERTASPLDAVASAPALASQADRRELSAPETERPKKPSRKGWWQKALGG